MSSASPTAACWKRIHFNNETGCGPPGGRILRLEFGATKIIRDLQYNFENNQHGCCNLAAADVIEAFIPSETMSSSSSEDEGYASRFASVAVTGDSIHAAAQENHKASVVGITDGSPPGQAGGPVAHHVLLCRCAAESPAPACQSGAPA
jgi:hypothetical protein